VLLAGDAAGLLDPLSGEGIYAALLSGELAATQGLAQLDGRSEAGDYDRVVLAKLGPELRDSSRLQDLFHLAPPVYVELLRRSDHLWHWLCRIIRGEETYTSLKERSGPFNPLINGLSWAVRHHALLGRRAGLPQWADSERSQPGPAQ
jgi:flavin-dependent dehydrogenase